MSEENQEFIENFVEANGRYELVLANNLPSAEHLEQLAMAGWRTFSVCPKPDGGAAIYVRRALQ